jgi:hypothetical protein
MGESKAYNITAAPQQTPYNLRSQEQAKYNKRTVPHDNRVSNTSKSIKKNATGRKLTQKVSRRHWRMNYIN